MAASRKGGGGGEVQRPLAPKSSRFRVDAFTPREGEERHACSPEGERPSALGKAHLLILNQVLSRGVTFVLNLLVVRTVGPEVFGAQSVNLYLLYTTILFLSREGLRKAVLKSPAGTRASHIVNQAWLCLPLAVLAALVGVWLGHKFGRAQLPAYDEALLVYAGCALLELLSEPIQLLAQRRVLIGLRVRIEGLATLAMCVATFLGVHVLQLGLLAFALGQTAYSGVILLGWLLAALSGALGLPDRLGAVLPSPADRLDLRLARVCSSFTFQSLERLALTEGEKFVLLLASPLDEGAGRSAAGVYGLVQNLGSLVARLIFQPIEESAFMQLSMMLSPSSERQSLQVEPQAQPQVQQQRDEEAGVGVEQRRRALEVLAVVLKTVLLVGLAACCFGPPYSFGFIHLAYGSAWSFTEAPAALACFCFYLVFMAVNGVTEAFMFAAFSPEQVKRYNAMLMVFSAIYLTVCLRTVVYGAVGLILANCVNMSCRIAYSSFYIYRFCQVSEALKSQTPPAELERFLVSRGRFLREIFPRPPVLGAMLGLGLVSRLLQAYLDVRESSSGRLYHLAFGVLCFAVLLVVIWKHEKPLIAQLRELRGGRKAKAS